MVGYEEVIMTLPCVESATSTHVNTISASMAWNKGQRIKSVCVEDFADLASSSAYRPLELERAAH
jgi:hypothetical protein